MSSKRVDKRIKKLNEDTNYTNVLTCPYCGYIYDDIDLNYSGKMECEDCRNVFTYEKHIIIEYSTYKGNF